MGEKRNANKQKEITTTSLPVWELQNVKESVGLL